MKKKSYSNFWIHYQKDNKSLETGKFIHAINNMKFESMTSEKKIDKNGIERNIIKYDNKIPFYVSVAHALAYNLFNNFDAAKKEYNERFFKIVNKKNMHPYLKAVVLSDLKGPELLGSHFDTVLTKNVSSLNIINFCGFMTHEELRSYYKYHELYKLNQIDEVQLKRYRTLLKKVEDARIQIRDAFVTLSDTGILETRKVANKVVNLNSFDVEFRGSSREVFINSKALRKLFSSFDLDLHVELRLKRIMLNRVMTLKSAREQQRIAYCRFVKYQAHYNETTKDIIAYDLLKEFKQQKNTTTNFQNKYDKKENSKPKRYRNNQKVIHETKPDMIVDYESKYLVSEW